ncbi:MAG: hypothetical protein INF12_14695 [Methylobacterium sp.]|nr:hypothetical protein [Methylobacterium sp.]
MTRTSEAAVIRRKIIKDIRLALIVSYCLPSTGTRPAHVKSNMPEYVREYFESYGLDRAKIGRLNPSNADISTHDAVMSAMLSHKLCDQDRRLLWARAAHMPWKQLVNNSYIPERTLKRHYAQALMAFAVAYGLVQIGLRRAA